MKRIKQDELFHSLSGFLKSKGVELKEGVYAQRIQRACGLLGEAINATQSTASKAKHEVDKRLDQLRQSIHEATAPRSTQAPPPPQPEPASPSATTTESPQAGASAPKPNATRVEKKKKAQPRRKRLARSATKQRKL